MRVAHLGVMRVAAVLAVVAGLSACSSSSKTSSNATSPTTAAPSTTSPQASTASGPAVTIKNFAFSPTPLTAKVGDTVTVTNEDNITHTFTADDGSFNTGPFASGSKTVKLTKAGTIAYHCNIHSSMHGTLQVS